MNVEIAPHEGSDTKAEHSDREGMCSETLMRYRSACESVFADMMRARV